jgi:hypothetical protein
MYSAIVELLGTVELLRRTSPVKSHAGIQTARETNRYTTCINYKYNVSSVPSYYIVEANLHIV